MFVSYNQPFSEKKKSAKYTRVNMEYKFAPAAHTTHS